MVALEFPAFARFRALRRGRPSRCFVFLRIEHLAVIDEVQVEFEPGLNVLTGETGAGKSMLVEAVGLLMGGRASADLIRTGETQASVQAEFDVADGAAPRRPRSTDREWSSGQRAAC